MEIGIIAPIKMLDFCCTRVHYVLPSLLLESEEYLDFYIEKQKLGHTIVMDCTKLGWKREPEIFSKFDEAFAELVPDKVILPSYMYDGKKTIEKIKEWIVSEKTSVGCLEGTSLSELEECREELSNIGVTEWALPAHCYRFAQQLEDVDYYIDNWENTLELGKRKGVLLTSMPVRLGLQGRLLSNFKPTPPLLSFKEEDTRFKEVIKKNIEELLDYYED